MLDLVFSIYRQAFTCLYNTLKTVKLDDNISLLTWILTLFVVFGIMSVFKNSFNLGSIRDSSTATYAKYQAKQQANKKQSNGKGKSK